MLPTAFCTEHAVHQSPTLLSVSTGIKALLIREHCMWMRAQDKPVEPEL